MEERAIDRANMHSPVRPREPITIGTNPGFSPYPAPQLARKTSGSTKYSGKKQIFRKSSAQKLSSRPPYSSKAPNAHPVANRYALY